jgi:hypothetical protein
VTVPRGPNDSERRQARGRVTDTWARQVTDRGNDVSAGERVADARGPVVGARMRFGLCGRNGIVGRIGGLRPR